jgi:hypothetical protein
MARKSTAILDTTGPQRLPLDAIPDDVKAFVEEVYKRQQKAPGRERVVYDSDQERDTEFKQIADYVSQRPAGVLKVRRSPSKDLPPHAMDLRFTADLEANGQKDKK